MLVRLSYLTVLICSMMLGFCCKSYALESIGKLSSENQELEQEKVEVQQEGEKRESDSERLKLLADIRVHSAEELEKVLSRVNKLFLEGGIDERHDPVVFLLHGEEARTLYKQNYTRNKNVVDLAAKLSAFDVVDIRVCEVWSEGKGLDNNRLQPFVETVPFAPSEKKRLVREEGYQYF